MYTKHESGHPLVIKDFKGKVWIIGTKGKWSCGRPIVWFDGRTSTHFTVGINGHIPPAALAGIVTFTASLAQVTFRTAYVSEFLLCRNFFGFL